VTKYRDFTPDELGQPATYHLINAVIAPRPIAWISTVSASGTFNLAPHSYTTAASQDPPIVCFVSIGRKDTVRNIEETGCFVYNVGSHAMVERINRTSADFPPDISEFEWAGLTPIPSTRIAAPRVKEAPVQMETTLVEIHRVADTANFIVMGEIVALHVAERLFDGDRVETARLDPVGRMAGSLYAAMGDVFSLKRPTYRGLLEAGEVPMEPSGGR
jgi:flavin reductase (DIM6/NTAB) family NADH-FMN oxidoreductase RutF